MYVEPHDLAHEFPNLTQAIDELRAKDERFAALFEQYHSVNREVVTLEERDIPVDDFTIEELKKTRLKLKDEIYERLRKVGHAA